MPVNMHSCSQYLSLAGCWRLTCVVSYLIVPPTPSHRDMPLIILSFTPQEMIPIALSLSKEKPSIMVVRTQKYKLHALEKCNFKCWKNYSRMEILLQLVAEK